MNDSHVKSLHYRVVPGSNVDYKKAVAIRAETPDFVLSVDADEAKFEMKTHYATKDEAKTVVDSYLRRWEVLIGLDHDPGDLTFIFESADVIDRAPSETDPKVLNVQSTVHIHTSVNAVLHLSRGKFPSLPTKFALSPDVETMYVRFRAFRDGRESLLSMAYMCLTVLVASAGGRANAAKKYNIAKPIFSKLGILCSERGSPEEARKRPKSGRFVPLSGKEKEWVTQVVKALIRRMGEHAYAPEDSLPKLTLADFPTLA